MAVSIVQFPKMNSSIVAKLDMAKKIHLKWERTIVKWDRVGRKDEGKEMAVSVVEFPKMSSSMGPSI